MSDTAITDEVSSLPRKTIVGGIENDSLMQGDDEARGDAAVVKREEDGDERDHAATFSQQAQKKKSAAASPAARSKNPSANISQYSKQQQQQQQNARYYSNNSMPPNLPGPRGPFPPMGRGYGGPPPYGYPGGNYGPPPSHYHPHPHMMQPYNNGPGGPYTGPPGGMKGNYHPPMPYGGGPGSYGMPPTYPPHHGMNQQFLHSMNSQSDSNSISSKSSMNSKKKRTIDGMHNPSKKIPTAYAFRRSDSNSSSTSTVTAGNNTSGETHHTEDSMHLHPKRSNGCEAAMSSLNMGGGMMFANEHHRTSIHQGQSKGQMKQHYHRRDYSGASTASSLSVGGFSLSSYERGRHLRAFRQSASTRFDCYH